MKRINALFVFKILVTFDDLHYTRGKTSLTLFFKIGE
jgi:hypothetical protein